MKSNKVEQNSREKSNERKCQLFNLLQGLLQVLFALVFLTSQSNKANDIGEGVLGSWTINKYQG